MTHYMIAAAAAALFASQAEAQVVISAGGFSQPAGIYTPMGGFTTAGYVAPYTYSSGYMPYYGSNYGSSYYGSNYYGGYSPRWSGYNTGYNYGTRYNTGYYGSNYGNYGRGMYRSRGWRW